MKTEYINDVASPLVQVLMETNESDTVLATYTYGNDLISQVTSSPSPVTSYYHYDGLGSTRQLTDDTETVVASYTYDAFGNVIAQTGASGNTYGFTGEQQFGEADGLVFLRARYYDPSIGRFISRDPILSPQLFANTFFWVLSNLIAEPQGFNSYVYAKNNPINHIDPTGLGDRYDICKGLPGFLEILCRKAVDAACNANPGAAKYCCYVDKAGCLTDKKCSGSDDAAFAEKAICEAKYLKCLAGVREK